MKFMFFVFLFVFMLLCVFPFVVVFSGCGEVVVDSVYYAVKVVVGIMIDGVFGPVFVVVVFIVLTIVVVVSVAVVI